MAAVNQDEDFGHLGADALSKKSNRLSTLYGTPHVSYNYSRSARRRKDSGEAHGFAVGYATMGSAQANIPSAHGVVADRWTEMLH